MSRSEQQHELVIECKAHTLNSRALCFRTEDVVEVLDIDFQT